MTDAYNFSDDVKKTLALAREESFALGLDYIDTEHLLLALTQLWAPPHARVLELRGIDAHLLRTAVLRRIRRGSSHVSSHAELPWTSRAKRVLEYAVATAADSRHSHVGMGHLLAGLLREERGLAHTVLEELGLTHGNALAEIAAEEQFYQDHGRYQSLPLRRILIDAEVPEWAAEGDVAEVLSQLVINLSRLHVLAGGAGLAIDDLEIAMAAGNRA